MNQIPNIEEEFDARGFIKKARKQNWKNGGVLAYDDEELVEELEDTFYHQLQKAREEEKDRICKDLDEMWSALYGAYLNNQDLRELIKNVVGHSELDQDNK